MTEPTLPQSRPRTLALIKARWHSDIVDQAEIGLVEELLRHEASAPVETFEVPGAFEIPLLAQRLALSGLYAGVIGAAFVVDGGIYRHDFVASTVVDALMQVQLKTEVPVFSVVLTPHQYQETEAHNAFFHDHFRLKGAEAARAALAMLDDDMVRSAA
ncbi:6,7-dimethyl-8-ribityllumazine synthase [Rhodobacteraceae bacterium NNCM2]|nr:6,7-dimethyl-8-ribityllumazine synthase [Coraliihabitans acroporae]